MINRVQYSPSFQKKLVANVDLPSQSGKEHCSIYELDEGKKDARRLNKQIKKQDWQYIDQFIEVLNSKDGPFERTFNVKVFSLEDEKKNCLGLVKSLDLENMKSIDCIEVNPNYRAGKTEAKVKNIAAALITYLMKISDNKDFMVLRSVNYLTADEVPRSIENNEQMIGSKIEIEGEKND